MAKAHNNDMKPPSIPALVAGVIVVIGFIVFIFLSLFADPATGFNVLFG